MQAHAAEGQQRRRKKKNDYPLVELQALASLPSPAPHCSRAQHPSWANHDRGWQPAVLLEGGPPAPTTGQGAAPSATPSTHLNTTEQGPSLSSFPRGVTEASSPQGSPAAPRTHLIPKLQDHSWASGSRHPSLALSRKTTKPQHLAQGRMGLGRGNSTAPAVTPSPFQGRMGS